MNSPPITKSSPPSIYTERAQHAGIALVVATLIILISLLSVGGARYNQAFKYLAQQLRGNYIYFSIGLAFSLAGALAYIFVPRSQPRTYDPNETMAYSVATSAY